MPSRLPQPPRTGSRPLPPAPTADDHDNPPPLPSRPAPSRGGGGGKPPPPRQNGRAMSSDESSEEEANYDDLDEQPMPARPAPFQVQPQAPTEIYDDLEGTAATSSYDMQEETYDGCQFESEPTAQEPIQDDFYTCADEGLPAPPAEQDGELYEFAPESDSSASPLPPPVPSSVPRRPGLPLPSPGQPPLPSRPLPPRVEQPEESSDVNPKVKKISAEGAKGLGISLADLDITRLKKVEPPVKHVERDPKIYEIEDEGDVKSRINKFKQKSEGNKPVVPLKPNLLSPVSSKGLGPPPPPPNVFAKKPEPTPVVKPAEEHLPPPPDFIEDDIYDEAMSTQQDPLQGYEWFHGKIDRKVSEQRLGEIGQDGTFLVRNSTKDDARQPYTLVVLFMGHNFNLIVRVRDKDKQVALGSEKPDEMAFKDVVELIEYHKKNPVIVVNKQLGQQETLLKKSPNNRGR